MVGRKQCGQAVTRAATLSLAPLKPFGAELTNLKLRDALDAHDADPQLLARDPRAQAALDSGRTRPLVPLPPLLPRLPQR